MDNCMPWCVASSDISPKLERLCSEGNTSVAESPVSPRNVSAMYGSSVVGISRLRTEGNEWKSWSHTMHGVNVSV